jgi:hypothetical protein
MRMSATIGAAQSMNMLIAGRAIQGNSFPAREFCSGSLTIKQVLEVAGS